MVKILQDCEEQHSQSHTKENIDLIKSSVRKDTSFKTNNSVASRASSGRYSPKGLGRFIYFPIYTSFTAITYSTAYLLFMRILFYCSQV
jgi:hypothetical protein